MNDIPGTAPEDEDSGEHAEAAVPAAPAESTESAGAGESTAPQGETAPESGNPPDADPADSRFADVVSGRFDEDEEASDLAPPKRVLLPQPETPKLHKILAQAGLGSRLEMEQLITEGRISVNNEPAHIGQRIQYGDQIKVNGKPIRVRIDAPPPRVIAYHKPTGEVVTHDDPQNRPTVFRKLPKLFQGKWQSVGRLDLNTEGLLLFTNSGELANKLMHPRFGLEREYAVRVLGALSNEEKQRLLDGVHLDDGQAQFGSIEDGGGEGSNCWYRVTISEGRNREVRRMFEAVGHAVSRLIRIRYGAMLLPRGLKRGASLELDTRDIQALMRAAGAQAPQPQAARGAGGRSQAPDRRGGGRNARGGQRQGGGGGEGGSPAQPRGNGGGRNKRGGPNPAGGGNAGARREGGNRSEGPIPNPLTVSTPGGQRRPPRDVGGGGGSGAQPDPMKTSFGYIGADSFTRQRQGQQRRGGGGGGGGGPQRRGGRGR
ncbi:pseudouridine synthase [Pseudorhodoferax sp. Leaf274]|uniref:pseudouridine synthase n=1 Tax=Pseudorhodoferax sp. Leaf274 TaxID=1736318 RepID=UPI0009EBF8EC|nr:pseudouridine synthase [Pseudorhodoferax sp. Leaf274]